MKSVTISYAEDYNNLLVYLLFINKFECLNRAEVYGYRLLVCNSHCHADREYSYIKMVTQNKVDGLIAVTYSNADMYKKAGIPIVSIDRTFDDNSCCVSSDNEMGGRLAAEKFI